MFRIGYLYYHKGMSSFFSCWFINFVIKFNFFTNIGYYKEALDEFEQALEIRRKLPLNLDQATTHRFIGETLVKLGIINQDILKSILNY